MIDRHDKDGKPHPNEALVLDTLAGVVEVTSELVRSLAGNHVLVNQPVDSPPVLELLFAHHQQPDGTW